MKILLVLCCLYMTVTCIRHKDQKITLHDIEDDYLTPKKTKPAHSPATKAPSPTEYGFVPVKTAANYAQQDAPSAYVKQYNQYAASQSEYSSGAQFASEPQYATQSQYSSQPQYSSQAHYSSQPQYSSQTQYSPQTQLSTQEQYSGQQYSSPDYSQYSTIAYSGDSRPTKYASQSVSSPPKYTIAKPISQPVSATPQTDYQNYNNVQYITDNSLSQAQEQGQGQAGQQFYSPQYLYLQPYQSPSTAVQTVVNPKGGLQYVMYIPTYVPTTSNAQNAQKYETIAANVDDTSSTYQSPQISQYSSSAVEYQQSYQPNQYVQPQGKYFQEHIIKKEPKSLLDSYVPSYLQVQHYNRQQQQNYVQEPVVKIPRKNPYKSAISYAPAESNLRYSYQRSPYKKYKS